MNRLLSIVLSKKKSDTGSPSVSITSNAVEPAYTGTFTATFTFNEAVTGFVLGDITVTGGVASALNTSDNIVFTCTITPSYLADVSISVASGVSGNTNNASNTLNVTASYQLGAIHSDNFNSNGLTPYSQNGSTMSAASGDLLINTTAGAHTNYLTLNTPSIVAAMAQHCLEKWKVQVLFTCPTGGGGSTDYGFGVGVRSNNGPEQFDNAVRLAFDYTQESFRGSVYYYNAQNHAAPSQTVATIGSQLMTAGTDYIFEVQRNKNVISAFLKTANGVTTLKTYNTFTYNIISTGQRSHNAGKFALWAYGGTNLKIKQIDISTNALKNVAILGAGDSNMYGLYAAANSRRFMEQSALALNRSIEIVAGINAEVPDVPVASILALTPAKIFVCIGSNDEANGVADATWQARFVTLFNALAAGGYDSSKVVIGIPPARNGVDIAAIKSFLDASYSAYTRADLYTTTKQGGNTSLQVAYNSGDNIHLSPAGNDACVTPVQTALN